MFSGPCAARWLVLQLIYSGRERCVLHADLLDFGNEPFGLSTMGRRMARWMGAWPTASSPPCSPQRHLQVIAAQPLPSASWALSTGRRFALPRCRYWAMAPVLAYFEWLCREAPPLAAADQGAWVRSLHRVLALLTEAFSSRLRFVAGGTSASATGAVFK